MKSTKSVQYYQDKLIEYDLIMDMALENLKKSYPLYKITNSAEYSKIYYNDSANVEKVFHDLFLLQNNLIKDSNTLSQLMEKQNNIIHNAKINYKKQSKLLSEQKDNDLASKPREKAYTKNKESMLFPWPIHSVRPTTEMCCFFLRPWPCPWPWLWT